MKLLLGVLLSTAFVSHSNASLVQVTVTGRVGIVPGWASDSGIQFFNDYVATITLDDSAVDVNSDSYIGSYPAAVRDFRLETNTFLLSGNSGSTTVTNGLDFMPDSLDIRFLGSDVDHSVGLGSLVLNSIEFRQSSITSAALNSDLLPPVLQQTSLDEFGFGRDVYLVFPQGNIFFHITTVTSTIVPAPTTLVVIPAIALYSSRRRRA